MAMFQQGWPSHIPDTHSLGRCWGGPAQELSLGGSLVGQLGSLLLNLFPQGGKRLAPPGSYYCLGCWWGALPAVPWVAICKKWDHPQHDFRLQHRPQTCAWPFVVTQPSDINTYLLVVWSWTQTWAQLLQKMFILETLTSIKTNCWIMI